MSRFLDGDFDELWKLSRSVPPPKKPIGSAAAKQKRARAHCKNADYSKTMQILSGSNLLDPCNPDVMAALEAKCEPPHVPRNTPPAPLDLDDDSKYLWSIGEITATAADGEKYQISSLLFVSTHMHKLRCQDHAGVTYEHWSHADFKFMERSVEDFMNARYVSDPLDHAFICGGSLLAPDKGGGDPRPIVSSLSIRRISLRVGMVQDKEKIANVFSKVNQFGIGVDGGVDHVYRMNHIALLNLIDIWESTDFSSLKEKSMLQPTVGQTDFVNCYNNIRRDEIIKQTQIHFPRYLRVTRMMYACPSILRLFSNGAFLGNINSIEGSFQGCPAGGFHASLGIYPLCQSLKKVNHTAYWIMDDCSPVGTAHTIVRLRSPPVTLPLKAQSTGFISSSPS